MGYSDINEFLKYLATPGFKDKLRPILQNAEIQDCISNEDFYKGFTLIDKLEGIGYWKSDYKRAYIDMLYGMDLKTNSNMIHTFINQCTVLDYVMTEVFYHINSFIEDITIDEDSKVTKITSRFINYFPALKVVKIDNNEVYFVMSDGDQNASKKLTAIDVEKANDSWMNFLLSTSSPKEILMPKVTKIIPDYCFAGNRALEKITIPQSCEKIGYSAFAGCSDNLVISVSRKSDIQVAESDLEFIKNHTKWRA